MSLIEPIAAVPPVCSTNVQAARILDRSVPRPPQKYKTLGK
jgi:hypothetical protein